MFIGFLGFAGFEFCDHHPIVQSRINRSNEKRQQLLNKAVFSMSSRRAKRRALPSPLSTSRATRLSWTSSRKRHGILPTLDDGTLGVKLTNENFVSKFIKDYDKHLNGMVPKFFTLAPLLFGIGHCAGDVDYSAGKFHGAHVWECQPSASTSCGTLPIL